MPVGIKNTTDGDVQVAVDGVRAAAASHVFMGINPDGLAALITTAGNPDCHVILRGGSGGPNHDAASVAAALELMRAGRLPARVIVDASHGNSGKDHVRQAAVAREIAARIAGGERGVAGVMLESFLVGGRQELGAGMTYGQSVTDACMGWDDTADVLDGLAAAVATRRA
jgi:3-deoxy-7-phosphoheptulonate synthase